MVREYSTGALGYYADQDGVEVAPEPCGCTTPLRILGPGSRCRCGHPIHTEPCPIIPLE